LLEQGHWDVLSLPLIAEVDEAHEIRTPFGNRTYYRPEGEPLHPARESVERIRELQAAMGPYHSAAQLQQRPAPAGGGVIRAEWFRTYDAERLPKFSRKVQSWDPAAKDTQGSDYSVCTTWGETPDRNFYLLDVYRARIQFPDLQRRVRLLAELHEVQSVLIEDTSSGIGLIQNLQQEGFLRIVPIKPKGTKLDRLIRQTPLIEGGKVWLPRDAHWLPEFINEATMFPNGRHDDQMDSMAQALGWLKEEGPGARWLRTMDEVLRSRENER
jgi:predicted phage terminase large subunit-like protein